MKWQSAQFTVLFSAHAYTFTCICTRDKMHPCPLSDMQCNSNDVDSEVNPTDFNGTYSQFRVHRTATLDPGEQSKAENSISTNRC